MGEIPENIAINEGMPDDIGDEEGDMIGGDDDDEEAKEEEVDIDDI